MTPEESYFLIYYLWLACTGHALAECDLLIDTRLAPTPTYARHVATQIGHATGLSVDLGDMRAAAPRTTLPEITQARIERSAAALFPPRGLAQDPDLCAASGDALAAQRRPLGRRLLKTGNKVAKARNPERNHALSLR